MLTHMVVEVVFFDVGETLIDESRLWDRWAAYLGIGTAEFRSVLDEMIRAGRHHRCAIEHFRPGLDIAAARHERAMTGDPDIFDERDLYPDAQPCLARLRRLGYRVGIAGNQPEAAETALTRIGFDADMIASSARWNVAKPSPAFFAKIVELAEVPPARIAYVGDRLDNDVIPARTAGLFAIFVERGPWGQAHAKRPEVAQANRVITSLDMLPATFDTG